MHPVDDIVNHLLADGVMTACVVVGSVLFAREKILGVEELSVGAGADLVEHGRFQVNEDSSRDVFAGVSLGEEDIEAVVLDAFAVVAGHLPIRLNAVLQTEQLPARIPYLTSRLAHVDADDLASASHCERIVGREAESDRRTAQSK